MSFFKSANSFSGYRVKRDSRFSIDPGEILLDAKQIEGTEDKGKIEKALDRRSLAALLIICLVIIGSFIGRTAYLAIINGSDYQAVANLNKTKTSLINAPRGTIYDRNGQALAKNIGTYDISINPIKFFNQSNNLGEIAKKMSGIINIEEDEIKKLFDIEKKDINENVIIIENIEEDKALELEGALEDINGIEVDRNYLREYPLGAASAQALGYVGLMNKSDQEIYTKYFLSEKVGKAGVEVRYEDVLHGEVGKKETEIDSKGKKQRLQNLLEPKPGNNLTLTIDSDIQKIMYDSLKQAVDNLGYESKRAAGIAMNPKTGKILAMVSLPSFDPNLFSASGNGKEISKLLNNTEQPFLNRSISGLYVPGSTVKIMVGAAGLQEKLITTKTSIIDSGSINVPSIYDPNIIYTFRDWAVHGKTDLFKAIAESCNIFFYAVGGGYGNINGLGVENMGKYFASFGLGEKTGIDLYGEKEGLIPTPAWKEEAKKEDWYLGDTYHMAIGQGDLLVTPIQMAVATSAIVNGGKVVRPYIVDKITDSNDNMLSETEPTLISRVPVDQDNLTSIKKAMREMIVNGTGSALKDLPISVAAKTGSAQYSTKTEKTRTWFTGFAPYEDPQIVLTLIVEESMMGRASVMPVAKSIFQYFNDNNK
ncbi:MAG: penicillin-binding protein 2 [Candidatus Portnoybacteria bacterium CG10_big_fil_rev_8_21_14_0_10_36_7]|uniref:Penicillin-binding protein 2 n=1 Tax=Candidatus Portnoybacteria bacterium CG10_big_fil_rev_8_21_14_0_10_36_7 TaxID=1974812 RepID=A0A2M8KE45_9BACT|nr:MAG: penicillin-binding protein 2 [Candidatus Portnoybacteria bacterium CG10_big_fil_rev_8_21_14_0_10_36_7]